MLVFTPALGSTEDFWGMGEAGGGRIVAFTCYIPPALARQELLSGIWLAANDQWAPAIMIGLAAL